MLTLNRQNTTPKNEKTAKRRTIVTNLGLVDRWSPLCIAQALAASRATCAASAKIAAEVGRESTCTAILGDRQVAAVAAGDEDTYAFTFESDVYGC